MLLPSQKAGRLMAGIICLSPQCYPTSPAVSVGPMLYDHLTIHQSVVLPETDLSHDDDANRVEVPHGLKQRWKPFGYSK